MNEIESKIMFHGFSIGDSVKYVRSAYQQPEEATVVGFTTDRVQVDMNGIIGLYWPQNLRKI